MTKRILIVLTLHMSCVMTDPVTNERFIINMEKDKLRDIVIISITRSNSVLTKRHYP